MRSAVAVVGGVIVSAVIVIGTIKAYDSLVAPCPGFCYFSMWQMYGHSVGEGRGAIPFIEIAVPAAAVALFVARALSPAGRQFAPALTAAWLEGNSLMLANLGDSRAYLIQGNRAEQLTVDRMPM